MKLSNKAIKLFDCIFNDEEDTPTMFKLKIAMGLAINAIGLAFKSKNNISEKELKEVLIELKNYYSFKEKSLKVSRDEFAKMEVWEQADFINEIYYQYTEERLIFENDAFFYDCRTEKNIYNLYSYAEKLNKECIPVHKKLFKK